jgi:hypothetical protein
LEKSLQPIELLLLLLAGAFTRSEAINEKKEEYQRGAANNYTKGT